MITIAISPFVKRQTPDSQFSHFNGTWEEVLCLANMHFSNAKPGYRDGVVLVPIPVDKCFTNIVQLQPGDKLVGEFTARQAGEDPRKSTCVVNGKKMPAKSAFLVLYRHDVLVEGNEQSCDADWEVISLNASPFEADVEVPMSVGTLIANHFKLSGGTSTKMNAKQFVESLRKSVEFWKDKAMAASTDVAVVNKMWREEVLDLLSNITYIPLSNITYLPHDQYLKSHRLLKWEEDAGGKLQQVHQHCKRNQKEIQDSDTCGCFYCLATFKASEIIEWAADKSALCPNCSVDSVLGDKSGYPVTDTAFLHQMEQFWFGGQEAEQLNGLDKQHQK
jgi:hypothetical protein